MTDKSKVSIRKLSDFRPLEANPNRHTQRGLRALEDSVQEDGWVAPVTVAADGESLDGAARLEVAADKFPDEALVVEHDGSRPVVMVRTDVADAESAMARRIVWRANRVAEIDLDWNPDQLLADLEGGLDLSGLFGKQELDKILAQEVDYDELWQGMPEFEQEEILGSALTCIVRFKTEEDKDSFEQLIGAKLFKKGKKYSIWFPPQDFDQLGRDLRFTDES